MLNCLLRRFVELYSSGPNYYQSSESGAMLYMVFRIFCHVCLVLATNLLNNYLMTCSDRNLSAHDLKVYIRNKYWICLWYMFCS